LGADDDDSDAVPVVEGEDRMRWLRAWILRIAGVVPRQQGEQDFANEIESHLELHIEEKMRSGMTWEQARREAILQLGGVEWTKQAYRERGTVPFFADLVQDLHFAVRQLRKNRGFAATAIVMLALGICANVAIFAFVDAALIKPLPYQNSSRLIALFESNALGSQYHLSYPDYLDWKRLNKVFSSMDVYEIDDLMLSTPTGAQKAEGTRVSGGFFRTLGVTPLLGRDFREGEDLASAPRVVMVSYGAWQRRFGGSKNVLGQAVTLNGAPNTIIGVLPPDFHFSPAEPAEFWATVHASGDALTNRGDHNLFGVARLKDGVSIQTALADMTSIAHQLEKQYPDSNRSRSATVLFLTDVIVGEIRPILLVLLSGAGLLLLIVCVNVSSLLLVRAESRKRETAVRSALGASRGRLIRQFATEGMLLVIVGSALGVASAYEAMRLLVRLIPADMMATMPYLRGIELNPRVLLFAFALSLFAGLLFSLTPVVRLPGSDMREGLAEGSRGAGGTVWRRFGANLVVVELAVAVVLLVSAGLLGKSFYRLLHVETGLQPDHLAMLQIGVRGDHYAKDEQLVALEREVAARVASLPGVKSVGISTALPVGDGDGIVQFQVVGKPFRREHNEANIRMVSASYFTTLQARLAGGRYFSETEDASKPPVAIINRMLAAQYFPGEDPINKHIILGGGTRAMEIVGVVDDIQEGPLDMSVRPAIYAPFSQNPDKDFGIVVRTSQTEQSLLPEISRSIHQVDPGIFTYGDITMNDRIKDSPAVYLHRSSAWLVGGFAGMALVLGVMGLYGVIAYSVSQRTREIGVRMALGAQRGTVYQLILREAGWLTAVGIVAGLMCSVAAAKLMQRLLFDVRVWDMTTLAAVAAVLGVAAMVASYLPARRAASVNPVEALRAE
jgi:macrolide transport system ATP-binding/permease protein